MECELSQILKFFENINMKSFAMKFAFTSFFLILIVGCSTVPTVQSPANNTTQIEKDTAYINTITKAPETEHLIMAKRFLHGFSAGEIALNALTKELDRQAVAQPGMTELSRKAFASIDADAFENLAATVYARHLTKNQLTELTNFIESDAGGRFFNQSVKMGLEGKSTNAAEMMKQFTADELIHIMKFAQSETFISMTQKLPIINSELKEEARLLGEAVMRKYLQSQ
jgi:hypothetical protein